jgi:hypothetical protein
MPLKSSRVLYAEIVSGEKILQCYFRAEMVFSAPFLNLLETRPEKIIRVASIMCLLYHFQLRTRIERERERVHEVLVSMSPFLRASLHSSFLVILNY